MWYFTPVLYFTQVHCSEVLHYSEVLSTVLYRSDRVGNQLATDQCDCLRQRKQGPASVQPGNRNWLVRDQGTALASARSVYSKKSQEVGVARLSGNVGLSPTTGLQSLRLRTIQLQMGVSAIDISGGIGALNCMMWRDVNYRFAIAVAVQDSPCARRSRGSGIPTSDSHPGQSFIYFGVLFCVS